MTDFFTALLRIKNLPIRALDPEKISVKNALFRILAEDLRAPFDSPRENTSAMDGFCFAFEDVPTLQNHGLEISSTQKISQNNTILPAGTCARIFTGAILPHGADTVVINEHVKISGEKIFLDPEAAPKPPSQLAFRGISRGDFVWEKAQNFAKNDVILPSNHAINFYDFGVFADFGVQEIFVKPQPKISIICVGDELFATENRAINDQNSPVLSQMARHFGYEISEIFYAPDSPEKIKMVIENSLQNTDFLAISGGMSSGDFDFTRKILQNLTLDPKNRIFSGIFMRPGKHTSLFLVDGVPILALSGNPNAAVMPFYFFARAIFKRLMGQDFSQNFIKARVKNAINRADDRLEFRPAQVEFCIKSGEIFATIAPQNESFMINKLSADFVAILDRENIKPDDEILVVNHKK